MEWKVFLDFFGGATIWLFSWPYNHHQIRVMKDHGIARKNHQTIEFTVLPEISGFFLFHLAGFVNVEPLGEEAANPIQNYLNIYYFFRGSTKCPC